MVTLTRIVSAPGRDSVLELADWPQSQLLSDEWSVVDEGFVAARNRYCAKKDGISEDLVWARHMAAVSRLLEAEGVQASTEMRKAYGGFSRHGGELVVAASYSPALDDSVDDEFVGSYANRIHGKLGFGGEVVPIQLQSIKVRPLPESEDAVTTIDLMRLEGSLTSRLQSLSTDKSSLSPAAPSSGPMPKDLTAAPQTAGPVPKVSAKPEAVREQSHVRRYVSVPVKYAEDHVGKRVHLQRRERGQVYKGVLDSVENQVLTVRQRTHGGQLSVHVPMDDIETMEIEQWVAEGS
jgi:hypothetical protein